MPNILWTDESLFTRGGMFNVHNEHYWDTENPYVFRERGFQKRFKINDLTSVFSIKNNNNNNHNNNFLYSFKLLSNL